MRKLLVLVFLKSITQIAETIFLLYMNDATVENYGDLIFTASCEWVNWVCT